MVNRLARPHRWLLGCMALAAALSLAGCALPDPSRQVLDRYQLALPDPGWVELPTPTAPARVAGIREDSPSRQRAWGLRGRSGEWQALVVLRVADARSDPQSWRNACPPAKDVWVVNAAGDSPNRLDCLRLRRHASFGEWLPKQRPDLASWVTQLGGPMPASFGHLSHTLSTAWGDVLSLDVVAAQSLLRPTTRSNDEFLRAGQPVERWSEQVALAMRQSVAMMDGHLALPPFPFSQPTQ